jgi:LacI family transcriptional regulator
MKDVASRAGVALKTVSRVVNGEPGVTPETAGRVLGAIEDLGFRRNESARLLRTGQTATLGFIAEDSADPDQAALYRGLEEVAAERGFLVYSGSTERDPAREERLALALCARRVDGMVIVPVPGDHQYLVAEIRAGVAAVFALRPPAGTAASGAPSAVAGAVPGNVALGAPASGRPAPGQALPGDPVPGDPVPGDTMLGDLGLGDPGLGDTVVIDERGGAKAAVAHLIAHGHRRIGLVGTDASAPDGYRSRRLVLGYTEAMTAAGLPVDEAWLSLTPGAVAGDRVTAVLCESRVATARALRTLAATGRARRVAVIGFGDLELADLVPPGITVVSYDASRIGRTAAELLVRRLAGDHAPHRLVELPARLVPRGSAEFPPDGVSP